MRFCCEVACLSITITEFVSLTCAILSLASAILIGVWQIYQNSRVNKLTLQQAETEKIRYDNALYSEATKFILKYSSPDYDSQIRLLPLCVMAYKYNPVYPYMREMYREFCTLSEDLQNLILQRCDLELRTGRCSDFFRLQVCKLKAVVGKNYPGDRDVFYDDAKYLERALLHHGSKERPRITCAIDKYQQADYDDGICVGPKRSVMDYDEHITNLLAYEKTERPMMRLLVEETSIGRPDAADEILMSHLCCKVAKYASLYSCKDYECVISTGFVCDFSGVFTMEDLFLDALLYMYCHNLCENDCDELVDD